MTTIVLSALVISSIAYLAMGYVISKTNHDLADFLPIVFKHNAKVETVAEFSASTVATTVSLATIVLAYFELAGYFGLYLLWTAITTAIGMYLVSKVAKRIWDKMSAYDHRPSLHEFLGTEFNSKTVVLVASICTSIGFLMIFATELIVGSRFLAKLVPEIPEWITVVFLSSVGFIYTLSGGFRVVIKTDQLQMKFIWGLIVVLSGYYTYYFLTTDFTYNFSKMPENVLGLQARPGLFFFLIGIAIMNIPTHISNMSIWQRISGAKDLEIVAKGFQRSIWSISLCWGLLALLACFAYAIVSPESNTSLLTDLLIQVSDSGIGKVILFFITLGLYGAMLSTASTNLIVVTHTVSEDILAPMSSKSLRERLNQISELKKSQIILFIAAISAIFLVEGLKYIGFSIADLVFAIYGGALALFPLILFALYSDRTRTQRISIYATYGVILGFVAGWGAAITGKLIGNSNLIFLSPTFGIVVSALCLWIGVYATNRELETT